MTRHKFSDGGFDCSAWPMVAYTELPANVRKTVQQRQRAIELYAGGTQLDEIETVTHIHRSTVYRLIQRCMTLHPDGRVYGFRALIPQKRVSAYRRQVTPVRTQHGGHAGLIGAFTHLLQERPPLREWIEQQTARRWNGILIIEPSTPMRLRGMRHAHAQFIQRCRDNGLTRNDYPLNTMDGALRTFSKHVRTLLLSRFAKAAHLSGATHLKGLPSLPTQAMPPARAPYEVVEFDAHRVDLRLKIVEIDPAGIPIEYEIDRVWLLVILDVFTRCVLGYNIVPAAHYTRFDVIRTIELALDPPAQGQYALVGMEPAAAGGFPGNVFPELRYACWQWFRLDNDTSNLAEDTLSTLSKFVGCYIDAGPPYHPDARPFVERFFGTLTRHLSHRLPGTTGSNALDLRRKLSDTKGSMRLLLTLNELEDMMDYAIADYNGTPHGSLNGRAPLEIMRASVRQPSAAPRVLPELSRRSMCLLQQARSATVRAYLNVGKRPHISLFGIAYTNLALAQSGALIGKRLLIYFNPSDLRSVRAFLSDGTEYGQLTAQGYWGFTRHTLKMRQEILRLKRQGQLRYLEAANPFDAYIEYHRDRAKKSKKHASAMAALLKIKNENIARPTTPVSRSQPALAGGTTSLAENAPEMSRPPPTSAPPSRPTKIKAKRLDIGTGHAFRSPF